jgi:hypothetical protein
VRQFYNSVGDLLVEFVQLLITFFDLFIQSLVLDLKLLEINQVKTISQLLLLLVDLVEVFVAITQRNILQTVLMNFTVLKALMHLPSINHGLFELFAGPREDSVLSDRVLKGLELSLNFLTFGLLFVKFGLEFGSHLIVTILGFLQVEAHLMHVSESVQVLVLVEHLLRLLLEVAIVVVHQVDFLLQIVVGLLQKEVLFTFVLDRDNQLLLHFWGSGQVTDAAIVALLVFFITNFVILIEFRVFLATRIVGVRAVLGAGALGSVA